MRPPTRISLAVALLCAAACQQAPVPISSAVDFGVTVTDRPAPEATQAPLVTGGQGVPSASYRAGELLVQLEEGADPATVLAGFERAGEINLGRRVVRLRVGMPLAAAIETLRGRAGVGTLSFNWKHRKAATYASPDDPYVARQWAHRQTRALDLWASDLPERNVDASRVIVAVLDTGLDVTHPEFAGRVVLPRDFTGGLWGLAAEASASLPFAAPDHDGHGTHVAGIIGAAGRNGLGVAGVAWDVKLMPLKVLGEDGGSDYDVLSAIAYALGMDGDDYDTLDDDGYLAELPYNQRQLRTRVISMSLGVDYHGRSPLYDYAFAEARKRGVVVVVAAGNAGTDVALPANSDHALAVSATSAYQVGDHLWEWLSGYSNRGDRIDLSAPGSNILSTVPVVMGSYELYSGTSMACPYVSGLAALVIARADPTHQRLEASFHDQVKAHLAATADDLGAPGKDPKYGYGRVNVRQALTTSFPAPLP